MAKSKGNRFLGKKPPKVTGTFFTVGPWPVISNPDTIYASHYDWVAWFVYNITAGPITVGIPTFQLPGGGTANPVNWVTPNPIPIAAGSYGLLAATVKKGSAGTDSYKYTIVATDANGDTQALDPDLEVQPPVIIGGGSKHPKGPRHDLKSQG